MKIGGSGICLRRPEIISLAGGGRITVCLIQEKPTDADTTTPLSRFSDSNPLPLFIQEKYLRQPDNNINGVDTTLRLSTSVSRNSAKYIPPVVRNPTPSLRWFRPDFFDGVDEDEVDTTLSLSPPGNTNKKSRVTKGKRSNDDDQNTSAASTISDEIYSPTPLRWFRQDCINGVNSLSDQSQVGCSEKKIRRGGNVDKRVKRRKINGGDDENNNEERPLVPIEEIQGLYGTLESRGGSGAVFLYRKKLEESDVQKGQNRLFVTRGERVMEFLREEEAAAVEGEGRGIKILGVDGGGKVYENMRMTKWASVKMIVINSDWRKVVLQNNAKKGDVVEIWGYRENQKPCLAFNFRREREMKEEEEELPAAAMVFRDGRGDCSGRSCGTSSSG